MSLSVCRTGRDSHPCSVACPTVGVFLKAERNCQRHAPSAAQDKPQPATVSKLGHTLHFCKVVAYACGNMIFPYLFLFSVPECPLPFRDISHGAVLCSTANVAGQQTQRCELFCDQGYVNTLPVTSFLCDPQAKNWLDDVPLSYACQSKDHRHKHCPIYLLKHSQVVAVLCVLRDLSFYEILLL